MATPPNVLRNQSFHIRIVSDIPEVQGDSSQITLPTLAPGVRLSMTVTASSVCRIDYTDTMLPSVSIDSIKFHYHGCVAH